MSTLDRPEDVADVPSAPNGSVARRMGAAEVAAGVLEKSSTSAPVASNRVIW